ncbi:MAG TPA: glycosyltransferase [Acidimicrobiia bacterium]|nr:glycosyltransferase [Acidimicrobiia bacterium]
MSQTTPQVADTDTSDESPDAPRVRILLTAVPDTDLETALAVLRRQVYEPKPEVVVVGAEPDGIESMATLEEAISSTDSSVDYLWLLHGDARPRPDALSALITESERNEASLAGSKLLKAGTMDELESVGGATDVFGEPYSGLDEGEIDLQQYDVVREVAFVQSASMLVRRDLAQGLKGLDRLLPPVAAGLDFSQRTRLAGGRVISVPSSEVYHQARCGERGGGWREQAGRLRAMITAYSPLTLLWVLPYDFGVSILDSLASLLLGRWKPTLGHGVSWLWNLYHIPSTVRQRQRLHSIRSEGDEELFRFHARGSIRLRSVGEELSGRVLSLFDEDQLLTRGSRRVWSAPGIWGAVIATMVVLAGARAILFGGMPNVGFSFPLETASIALARWIGGWNESGLGSAASVHPGVGLTGLLSLITFGAEGAARTLMTLVLVVLGIVGMGRLAGRIGLRGPGRYLSGLVLLAGPGTAALTQRGSWLALCAAAVLPWAVRACFIHPHELGKSKFSYAGWALLTGVALATFSPLLAFAPLLTVVVWRLLGGDRHRFSLGLVAGVGIVSGVAFLLGDPGWVTDSARRLGVTVGYLWPVVIAVAAVPMVIVDGRARPVAATGGVISLTALAVGRYVPLAPGVEEAVFIMASFGAALAVAGSLDSLSRNVLRLVAAAGGVAILVLSVVAVGSGRLGLPSGDVNERLAFATTLADEGGPGRILYASVDRDAIPGEARSGPGFWYRVVDGDGLTLDEVWLPEAEAGDDDLASALTEIASGANLRPGARLAPFAIDWVVLEGPRFVLDEALAAQLDLAPIPLDPESRVYENPVAMPLAGTPHQPWEKDGLGFAGPSVDGPIAISSSYDRGWQPEPAQEEWYVTVDGSSGETSWQAPPLRILLATAALVGLVASFVLIGVGRRLS